MQDTQHRVASLAVVLILACTPLACAESSQEVDSARVAEMQRIEERVIEDLATALETTYVFPEVGRRYAAALRQQESFEADDASTLAEQLTARLQAVQSDAHVRVMPPEGLTRPSHANGSRSAAPETMEAVRWLAPGVSYVRFNLFPGDPGTLSKLSKFVDEYADAKTLIVDVRGHRGGGLAEMDILFAELFSEDTLLVHMDTRKSVDEDGGSPIVEGPTVSRVEAASDVVRRAHFARPADTPRLAEAQVYVLTSGYTASAAEHFTLALKRTGRAKIVGASTRGGGHFGGTVELAAGFTVFVPVGRTFDPETGEDWEGDGVAPDLPVAAETALLSALVDSGLEPSQAMAIDEELDYRPPTVR